MHQSKKILSMNHNLSYSIKIWQKFQHISYIDSKSITLRIWRFGEI